MYVAADNDQTSECQYETTKTLVCRVGSNNRSCGATFFAGIVLLTESWFAAIVAQAGLTLESFVVVFVVSAIVLSTGAFVILCKQKSLLGSGLLAASGAIFMIHPLTNFITHLTHPQMTRDTREPFRGDPSS
jgi:hypothetical protein